MPIAYGFAFNFFIFLAIATERYPSFESFAPLMLVHSAIVLLVMGLLAFYLWFLFDTDRIAADKKPLWAVVLFLGNVIAMPVFWYIHIWKPTDSTSG